jgi:hypothetical protein
LDLEVGPRISAWRRVGRGEGEEGTNQELAMGARMDSRRIFIPVGWARDVEGDEIRRKL